MYIVSISVSCIVGSLIMSGGEYVAYKCKGYFLWSFESNAFQMQTKFPCKKG